MSQFGFVFPVAPKPCAVKDQSGIGTYKRIGTFILYSTKQATIFQRKSTAFIKRGTSVYTAFGPFRGDLWQGGFMLPLSKEGLILRP